VAIHVCTYHSTIRSGFDIQVAPERIAIHGVNGCNGEPGAPPVSLPPVIVDLADLRARRDWSDFALWVVGVDFYANRCFEPFNLYALTAATKYDPQQQAQRDRRSYPIHIFVPTAESDFLDCSIVAYAHPELGLTSNLPVVPRAWTGKPLVDRPGLRLSGPATITANGTARIAIDLLDHRGEPFTRRCDIFLETTGGQIARPRLQLEAGQGSVAVQASALEPGERFKVKAGFRHFSGVAEHWFEVVA